MISVITDGEAVVQLLNLDSHARFCFRCCSSCAGRLTPHPASHPPDPRGEPWVHGGSLGSSQGSDFLTKTDSDTRGVAWEWLKWG